MSIQKVCYNTSMIPIVQKGEPILRLQAMPVPLSEITSPQITKVIKRMTEALYQEEDGVAIAAPQIGESLRIFIVSGKILSPHYPDLLPGEEPVPDLVCINPEIIKLSKQKKKMAEGCLSVRWLYGNVKRSTKATIQAYNQDGIRFTRGGAGLLAQIFQHETDHLNGILFIDTAEDIEDMPPETHSPKKLHE
jgi:peptide deformylase